MIFKSKIILLLVIGTSFTCPCGFHDIIEAPNDPRQIAGAQVMSHAIAWGEVCYFWRRAHDFIDLFDEYETLVLSVILNSIIVIY